MPNLRVLVLILVWIASSHGCAYLQPADVRPPPADVDAAWKARLARLQAQDDWMLKGKISVRNQDDGFTAGLHWKQTGERYEIELYDPLGRKTAIIRVNPGKAEIETSSGEYAAADNAESLMEQQLGWSAPLSSLRYWVLGIPNPVDSAGAPLLDAYGRLSSLNQSTWAVRYPQYSDDPEFPLPERILAMGQKLDIKLIVKDWELAPRSLSRAR